MVLFLGGLYAGWNWFFCRFYVDPNEMAIITAKAGEPLAPGQILAKQGQLGVQEEVLGEGRHFLNPFFYEIKIVKVIVIPAGRVGIVTSKVGNDLPPGQFLAENGQKGIWREVLGPGKYRLNPEGYNVEIVDAVNIPIGYVGVMTSLSGDQTAPGEFAGNNQKGVRKDVLQPGLYYVNPKMYKVDILEIGVNQVSLLGREGGRVITKGRIGTQNVAMEKLATNLLDEQRENRNQYQNQVIQNEMAQGTYADKEKSSFMSSVSKSSDAEGYSYSRSKKAPQDAGAKPQAAKVLAEKRAEAGSKAEKSAQSDVALEFWQNVEFPSRDGFLIHIDMTVEFELLPKKIAEIYRSYGDLPAVVDKIILPQIQSVSRLKGSAYRAKDLIVGDGREQFQIDLKSALESILGEKQLVVHNALIRHVGVPEQILDPIQKASIAIEENLTNKEKQNTAKKQAELNTQLSLIEQAGQQVGQETLKLKAEIKASQDKQVATTNAEAIRSVAEIEKKIADIRAETKLKLGSAKAEEITLVEGERARGYTAKTDAFGDPMAFNLYQFALNLNPNMKIRILHAGEGTLWTDLEKATMGDLGGAKQLKKK